MDQSRETLTRRQSEINTARWRETRQGRGPTRLSLVQLDVNVSTCMLPPHLYGPNITKAAGQLRVLHINSSWALILPVYAPYVHQCQCICEHGIYLWRAGSGSSVRPQLRHASHSQSPVICAKNSCITSAHYLPSQRDIVIPARPATYYSYYYEYLVGTFSSLSSHSISASRRTWVCPVPRACGVV